MSDQWLAVRCCCNGERILGFLKVTQQERERGTGRRSTMTVGQSYLAAPFGNAPLPVVDFDNITFRLQEFHSRGGDELAVYSEDRPVEFWRNVRGFVEAAPNIEGR